MRQATFTPPCSKSSNARVSVPILCWSASRREVSYAEVWPAEHGGCRYVVPAASATQFEAALQEQQGRECVAQLTAKHLYCSLPVQLLKQLGVRRFLQMPGYAVLTYPVRSQPPTFTALLLASLHPTR